MTRTSRENKYIYIQALTQHQMKCIHLSLHSYSLVQKNTFAVLWTKRSLFFHCKLFLDHWCRHNLVLLNEEGLVSVKIFFWRVGELLKGLTEKINPESYHCSDVGSLFYSFLRRIQMLNINPNIFDKFLMMHICKHLFSLFSFGNFPERKLLLWWRESH